MSRVEIFLRSSGIGVDFPGSPRHAGAGRYLLPRASELFSNYWAMDCGSGAAMTVKNRWGQVLFF